MKTAGSMQPRVELRNHQPAVAHDTLTIEHTHDLPDAALSERLRRLSAHVTSSATANVPHAVCLAVPAQQPTPRSPACAGVAARTL